MTTHSISQKEFSVLRQYYADKIGEKRLRALCPITVAICTLKENGLYLQLAPPALKNNKTVVLEAVSQNGTSLKYASPRLQDDEEIVSLALKNSKGHTYIDTLLYASERVKSLPRIREQIKQTLTERRNERGIQHTKLSCIHKK